MNFGASPTVRFAALVAEELNSLGAEANASEEISNSSRPQSAGEEIASKNQSVRFQSFDYSEVDASEEIKAFASAFASSDASTSVQSGFAGTTQTVGMAKALTKEKSFKAVVSLQSLWRGRQSRKSLKVSNLHTKDLATAHAAKLRAIYASCRRKLAEKEKPKTLKDLATIVLSAVRQVSWTSGFLDNVNYHALWGNIWGIICKAWACEPDDIRVVIVLEKQLKDILNVFPKKKNATARRVEEMREEIEGLLNTVKTAKEAHIEARKCQYQEYVQMLEKELEEIVHHGHANQIQAEKEAEKMRQKLDALLDLTNDAMELHSGTDYFDKKKFKALKKHLEGLLKQINAMNFDKMDAEEGAKALKKMQQKAGAAFDIIRKAEKMGKAQWQITAARKKAKDCCDELHDSLKTMFEDKPKNDDISQARSKCVLDRLGKWDPHSRLAPPEFIEIEEEVFEPEAEEEEARPFEKVKSVRKTISTRQTIRKTLTEAKFEAEAPEYEQCSWESADVNPLISKFTLLGEGEPEDLPEDHEDHEDDDASGEEDASDDGFTLIEDFTLGEDLRRFTHQGVDMILGLDEGRCSVTENISLEDTQDVPTRATTAGSAERPGSRPTNSRSTAFGDIEFVDPDIMEFDLVDPDPENLHDEQEREPSLKELWSESGWTPVDQRDDRWHRWRHQSQVWQSLLTDSDEWFRTGERASTAPSGAVRTGKGFHRSYNRGGIPGWRGSSVLNLDLDPKVKDACDPSGQARGPKLLRESRSAALLPHPSKAKGAHSRLYQQDAAASPATFVGKLCSKRLTRGSSASRLMLSRNLSESAEKPNHPNGMALHLRARMDVTLEDDGGRFSSWHARREQRRSMPATMPAYYTAEATEVYIGLQKEIVGRHSLVGSTEVSQLNPGRKRSVTLGSTSRSKSSANSVANRFSRTM